MGGLGAAGSVSVGRSPAVQQRGGPHLAPCVFLLHVLLGMVFYDVAVVVSLHRGGARGVQLAQQEPRRTSADWVQSQNQLVEEAEAGRRYKDWENMKSLTLKWKGDIDSWAWP